jgi:diguanylate cyclase (GGDEF)-like protein
MNRAKNRRVLVVDDQQSIHDDYRKVIGRRPADSAAIKQAALSLFGEDSQAVEERETFEVDSAFQGEEGFRMVQKALEEGRPYALAFVDIRMPPGWNGVETVKRIWEVDPEILVVICSAYSDYSWEQIVDQLGRSDRFLILKKPFEQIEVRQFAVALTERWNLVRCDALTGLMNRRAFAEHLHREHARAVRHGTKLSCAMLDLDYFKRINDEIGHAAGDLVLKAVAELLRDATRACDYLCRYGGEELCVLLPQTDEKGAFAWAEKFRPLVAEHHVESGGNRVHVTVSIGVAELRTDLKSPEALVERADHALRAAKQGGRNQVVTFGTLDQTEIEASEIGLGATPFGSACAADVMTSPILCLPIDATVGEAADVFLRCGVPTAAVAGDDGKLCGVVSEKELMPQLLLAEGELTPIRRLMRTNVVSYTEDSPVERIFDFLSRVTVSQVIVVRDQKPIGVVNRAGLLRWLNGRLSRGAPGQSSSAREEITEEARARARKAVEELTRRACLITEESTDMAPESVSPLLEVMFKMQELMNDLVACIPKPWPDRQLVDART